MKSNCINQITNYNGGLRLLNLIGCWAIFGLYLFLSLTCPQNAKGFSCNCLMDQQVASADFNKFGTVNEFCTPTPPVFYLTRSSTDAGHNSHPAATFTHTLVESWSVTNATHNPTVDCSWSVTQTETYFGSGSAEGYSNAVTLSTNGLWLDNVSSNFVECIGHTFSTDNVCNGGPPCGGCGLFAFIYGSEEQGVFATTNCVSNLYDLTYTNTNPDNTGYYEQTIAFSDPFTDDILNSQVTAHLPEFPGWTNGTAGGAFYKYNAMSGIPATDHRCASGGKMKYRLKVPDSEKGASYDLTWQEVTTTVSAGGATNIVIDPTKAETITGTGDPVNPAVGSEHPVPMPTLTGDLISITIQELNPTLKKVETPDLAGDGGDD